MHAEKIYISPKLCLDARCNKTRLNIKKLLKYIPTFINCSKWVLGRLTLWAVHSYSDRPRFSEPSTVQVVSRRNPVGDIWTKKWLYIIGNILIEVSEVIISLVQISLMSILWKILQIWYHHFDLTNPDYAIHTWPVATTCLKIRDFDLNDFVLI